MGKRTVHNYKTVYTYTPGSFREIFRDKSPTDLEKFVAMCAELGLVYYIEKPDDPEQQTTTQFEYESGNGGPGGPIFYFNPDGSLVCQE